MSIWLYRWPNGDCSIVWGARRIDAVEVLDEIGAAIPEQLIPLTFPGAVNFVLADTGLIELEGFSESVQEKVEAVYPILEECKFPEGVDDLEYEPLPEQLQAAIKAERERVTDPPDEARTPQGRLIQKRMGLSGALADKWAFEDAPTGGTEQ